MTDDIGYIKLYRQIRSTALWKAGGEYTEREAWIDILMEARWKDEPDQIVIGKKVLLCNKGECLKSLDTWAKRWGWKSKKRVRTFLSLLEKLGQITVTSETVTIRLSVCNYASYQDSGNGIGNGEETEGKRIGNAEGTQKKNNKNDKNEKKDNPPAFSERLLAITDAYIKNVKQIYPSAKLDRLEQAGYFQKLMDKHGYSYRALGLVVSYLMWTATDGQELEKKAFNWQLNIRSSAKLLKPTKDGTVTYFEALFVEAKQQYYRSNQTRWIDSE